MSKKEKACPRVDIGGQAVMEGVMMKAPDAIAISVRRPDGTIVVKRKEYTPLAKKHPWMGWPIIRGVINMGMMLASGMSTLQESTEMLGIMDEEPTKFEKWLAEKLGKGIDKIVMGVAVILAVFLSVGLFIMIPAAVESGLMALGVTGTPATIIGGIVKILILIGYMIFCGFVPDVRRTFQYHGAEHKTVYCNENGEELTVENCRKYPVMHPRCGTAFLLIVMVISILVTSVASVFGLDGNVFTRILVRLILLPIVAGLSYELLQWTGRNDNWLTRILRWPGMQLQRLTALQPTDDMLEVAIVAMKLAKGEEWHDEADEQPEEPAEAASEESSEEPLEEVGAYDPETDENPDEAKG